MAVETPTINQIIKMNEFDLMRTNIHKFNMYMCLDSQRLYYDSTDSASGRVVYNYIGVKTINDLLYNITPEFGRTYYCWEDNSLWIWMNKWITLWTDSTYPSAYQYTDWNGTSGSLGNVYRYDDPLMPADDNGLLHDGSVIVRDRLRIIKGKLYIDDGNDNLVISSYLGGGIRFLPNGLMDTNGEFFISDESNSFLRSQLTIKNNEVYVNYAEVPAQDPAAGTSLEKNTHNYKVYHEGNLDASLIQPLTGEAVYNALIADKATLPDPFDFNVSQLDGLTKNDFARTVHTHTASQITDFNTNAQSQAQIVFTQNMNNAIGEGITITQATASTPYKFSANTFRLTLTGGATGNVQIRHLTDTSLNVVVDPDEHVHQNYIDTMTDLQNQINALITIDPNDYYNKIQVDALINGVTPTTEPTPGKALQVNNSGILPVGVITAQKLDSSKHIELTGDITGSVDTDFQNNTITINTSADNILSSTATPGKALAINQQGNLPANATSASQLNHTMTVTLSNEVTGSATLDTSLNAIDISCTLVPGSNILQDTDLNVLVPQLENVAPAGQTPSYKIKTVNIPDVLLQTSIKPQGTFDPNDGEPSNDPSEGYMWTVEAEGTLGGQILLPGDQYVYLNGAWNLISGNQNVISVNNKQGRVTLDYSDVGGISDTYINYTVGQTVPSGKIPITTANGVLGGVSVSNLTNQFSLITQSTGDVAINTTTSTNTDTDGSENLDVVLEVTSAGYQNILDTVGHVYQSNGTDLTHKQKLNFTSDFTISDSSTTHALSLAPGLGTYKFVCIENKNTVTQDNLELLDALYDNKNTNPIMVVVGNTASTYGTPNNDIQIYLIDKAVAARPTSSTVVISSINQHKITTGVDVNGRDYTKYGYATMTITFDSTSVISGITFDDIGFQFEDYYLTTAQRANGAVTTAFTPTLDYQAASKKYVDDTVSGASTRYYKTNIGDGSATIFTITHNLGTQDVLIQFRDNVTKQQVYIDNTIVDDNTIVLTTNTVLTTNQVSVYILSLVSGLVSPQV